MANSVDIRHINVDSDFKVLLSFKNGKIPSCSWQIVLYTPTTDAFNRYSAGFDGNAYSRCIPVNDSSVLIMVDDHHLRTGTLKYRLIANIPDADFQDGIMDVVMPGNASVELWDGVSDDYELPVWAEAVLIQFLRGESAYEAAVRLSGYEGTEEEYVTSPIYAAEKAMQAAEAALLVEGKIIAAEDLRVKAESSREGAEETRSTQESVRVQSEQTRVESESRRSKAEGIRVKSEADRVSAETGRTTSESTRVSSEQGRTTAETFRVEAEQKRQTDTASAIKRTDDAATKAGIATEHADAAAASLLSPQEVLAHSDCTLEERVAHLEQLLIGVITGKVFIPKLSVKDFEVWGDNNLIIPKSGAPTLPPDRAGQLYIDTKNNAAYKSTGNTAVADWKIM